MPTPSAEFTVNASAVSGAVAVSASSVVTLAIASTYGVNSAEWSIFGNHSSSATNPTITASGSRSETASFTVPAGVGQGYGVLCKINGGVDALGRTIPEYTFGAIIGVAGTTGIVPLVLGEKLERGDYGWLEVVNQVATSPGALVAQSTNTVLQNSSGGSAVPSAGDIQLLTATQGTATAKIAPYPTMADLRAVTPVSGRTAETQGHTTAGIGPGKWIGMTGAASTWTHDGITTIVPASGTGSDGSLAWVSLEPGAIEVRRAGAVCDGTANDSAETIAALAAADPWISFPPGVSVLAAGMSLDGDKSVEGNFTLLKATANNDVMLAYASEYTNLLQRVVQNLRLNANSFTGVVGFRDEGSIRTTLRNITSVGMDVHLHLDGVSFYSLYQQWHCSGGRIGLWATGGTLAFIQGFYVHAATCGMLLEKDNFISLAIQGQECQSLAIEASSVGGIIEDVEQITFRGLHLEENATNAGVYPLTVEGRVLSIRADLHIIRSNVRLIGGQVGSNNERGFNVTDNSTLEIQNVMGTISPTVPMVVCDATSRASWTGPCRLYSDGNVGCDFDGSSVVKIDSWGAARQAMRFVSDPGVRNLYAELGGSTWVPTLASPSGLHADGVSSRYDSLLGPVSYVHFAASAGNTGTNRVVITSFSGSVVAGRVQGVRFAIRCVSGSGRITVYSPRGANNLVATAVDVTTDWQVVSAGGTVSATTSSDTLVFFYPSDSAGLEVLISAFVSWDVARPNDCLPHLLGHITPKKTYAAVETITTRSMLASDFDGRTLRGNGTVTYTALQDSDLPVTVGDFVALTNSSASVFTIAAGSGATVDAVGGTLTVAQHETVRLRKSATNAWKVER